MEAGGDHLRGGRVREHIPGELFDGEPVVGHVFVEGADDPVAPGPDRAAAVFLIAVGVGVARQVEPVSRPALAVAGRFEQPVDQGRVGLRALVVDESVGLFRRGRQADEIEVEAANQCVAVSFSSRFQLFFLDACQDELVDRVAGPGSVPGCRQRGLFRRDKGPVPAGPCSPGDPFAQELLLALAEGRLGFFRRHPLIWVIAEDALNQRAVIRLPWVDGAGFHRRREVVEPQLRLARLLVWPVAGIAFFRQDRPDIAIVVDLVCSLQQAGKRGY